jgi:hypothetical protein
MRDIEPCGISLAGDIRWNRLFEVARNYVKGNQFQCRRLSMSRAFDRLRPVREGGVNPELVFSFIRRPRADSLMKRRQRRGRGD